MADQTSLPKLEDFPLRSSDKVRYGDTDRQGHVNNIIFAQYLETGRVELIYDAKLALADEGCSFVIAKLVLEFRAELQWPGLIEIGTGVVSVGKSSMSLRQALFQNGKCAAVAETVIVHISGATHRGHPLSAQAIEKLQKLMVPAGTTPP
jgi:acyl-CoA thioester hydrolase